MRSNLSRLGAHSGPSCRHLGPGFPAVRSWLAGDLVAQLFRSEEGATLQIRPPRLRQCLRPKQSRGGILSKVGVSQTTAGNDQLLWRGHSLKQSLDRVADGENPGPARLVAPRAARRLPDSICSWSLL